MTDMIKIKRLKLKEEAAKKRPVAKETKSD